MNRFKARVALRALGLVLATAPLAMAAAAAAGSGPVAVRSVLPELDRTQSFTIDEVWNGFTRVAPIESHYALQRSADGFAGHVEFSAGGGFPGGPTRAAADVAVPQAVIDAFLRALAEAPIRPGSYVPKRGHSDDYPDLTITVDVGGVPAIFASQSQGKQRAPWALRFGGREFVSDSAALATALALLDPYLERDVRARLIEKVSH